MTNVLLPFTNFRYSHDQSIFPVGLAAVTDKPSQADFLKPPHLDRIFKVISFGTQRVQHCFLGDPEPNPPWVAAHNHHILSHFRQSRRCIPAVAVDFLTPPFPLIAIFLIFNVFNFKAAYKTRAIPPILMLFSIKQNLCQTLRYTGNQ
jgi:hypothetical protein